MLKLRRKINAILILLLIVVISNCSTVGNNKSVELPKNQYFKPLNEKKEQKKIDLSRFLKPVKKKISILDLAKVSIFSKSISYKDAIIQILKPYNLNVAFDSALSGYVSDPNISISLNNVSLRKALNTITGIVGVNWEKRGNVIWITPFVNKVFDLGFLGIVRSSQTVLGGDVLGGSSNSDNNVTTPLKGSFTLTSSSAKGSTDIYKVLEDNIKKMLSKQGTFSLDKASGILFVRDDASHMKMITDYIDAVRKAYSKQVMIEAKIIEINLKKQWQLGINWDFLAHSSKLNQTVNITQETIDFGTGHPAMTINISRIFHPGSYDVTFDSVIQALSQFGALKLISEPHIRVMNGQPALLSVGRSISFIKDIEVTTESTQGGTITTPTVDISSVFDGIMFGITPYIRDDGRVLLRIVPIKSNLVALQEKEISGNTYTLPIMDIREASSVVSVKNGDIIAVGGLISKTSQRQDSGVPILSDLPVVGSLFKQRQDLTDNIELIILLKPIIIQ
ncbi:type II secretion system protein GspD [Hippea alviniae]|uniref:type II secretion system protein GspD n=1 Tax=Hippea alviniae TaxID=1279027 RepID=UPI0003B3960B|nr:hypothetical protein [Hippea alviniae]